jgi:fermentation-respiration switch protein FrsA (DUF1100 family)
VLTLALGGALLFVALLWAFQRSLIYLPDRFGVPPAAAALPGAEDVSFETEDSLRLQGWFLPAESKTGAAAIVFNGNAGNRSHRAALAAALSGIGVSVLLFDYRGYGGNPGTPTESGLLADARAARAYLASRVDVDERRLIYFGESLGGAVATALAEEHRPAALILRSPFTSVADMARLHYPFLPVHPLLLVDRYDTIGRIGSVRCPVLVIAGERDGIVPLSHSLRVYQAANDPKRWATISGADHNDRALLDGERLISEVRIFIDGLASPPR